MTAHHSVERNWSFCNFCCFSYMAISVVSMEFSEGTDADVEQDFVRIGDIELPDDNPVHCGSEFCVICNKLATEQQPPLFGPCLSWPNGWMHQDATWHAGRPLPMPHCVRWGPSSPQQA